MSIEENTIKPLRPTITKNKGTADGAGFKKYNRAKFVPIEKIPIASRDYGLMKSNNKSSTPYPRVDHGVDATVLRARLSMRRQLETKRNLDKDGSPDVGDSMEGSSYKLNRAEAPHMGSSRAVTMTRGSNQDLKHELSLGTPHPKKGVALNAKMLTKRISTLNKTPSQTTVSGPATPRSSTRKKGILLIDSGSSAPPKTVQSGLPMASKGSFNNKGSFSMEYSLSESLLMSIDSSEILSFAEKRRRFNMGEFTLTKGRKMSDVMMAGGLEHRDGTIVDRTIDFANKAKQEIENYIQKQGLIKTTNDQLTMTRALDRVSRFSAADAHSIKTIGSLREHSSDDSHKGLRHGRKH
ncbi:uncharacterized protein Dana_GF18458 [Drosophila ananassae]|uniref:Uncharacterized protein n=1 Tax=Drosophila ananassae TaxID=7217 RepID=B3M251_DROAN|nr:uncharacterized protein LOC6501232 [Drosophila ananassae]EDV43375.1 uncharacterized protein Dana_GF18458 [Drosophila ananassae]